MGLLDEWNKVKRDENNREAVRKFALGNNAPKRPAYGGANRLPEDVIQKALQENTEGSRYPKPTDPSGANLGGARRVSRSMVPPPPEPPSPLEILMERLNQGYSGPDPSKMDFTALDKALETRLGMLNGARDRIRGNFNQSDQALAGMHRAFENQVRTEDAARYNQISDQQKANLNANRAAGVGDLEAARAKQVAERAAMLKNLGIQEAGRAPDVSQEALNRGIDMINQRNNINQNLADSQRGTNLAYNNTVAQSIGQAGVARRSALQQQLAGLLGKVDMAESEAKAQNEIERQRSMTMAEDSGYDRWKDEQDRNLRLFDILTEQETARERMGNGPETRPTGFSAVAANLEESGIDPGMAQRGLRALAEILSEGNYLEGANGPEGNTPYDRVNILTQRLKARDVDPMTATQIAISYGNL